MDDRRPDNGGGSTPDDGGPAHPNPVPDLPPEWGTIIVPDDAAALAGEAVAIRRELRRAGRRARLRRLLGRDNRRSLSSVGVPLVILAVAILVTMASLFVVTLGRQPQAVGPTAASRPQPTSPTPGGPGSGPGEPDLTSPLRDTLLTRLNGASVRLGDVVPAVVVLVDACACDTLLREVTAAAPPGVRVLAVAAGVPALPAGLTDPQVLALADPTGLLRARYFSRGASPGGGPSGGAGSAAPLPTPTSFGPGHAQVLVVNRSSTVVAVIPDAASVRDIGPIIPD